MEFGSSPRVRGTLAARAFEQRVRRFIPACAGNATGIGQSLGASIGSSPRVRGTHISDGLAIEFHRFIPACAGNARASLARGDKQAVHPRVCGERGAALAEIAASDGSSPRVRGTPRRHPRAPVPRRFIPACAGNAP